MQDISYSSYYWFIYLNCISTVPATIAIAPSDTEATINSTIFFTCVAYGDPIPSISWFIDSERLYNDTNSSSLLIFTELFDINGEYLFVHSILQLCGVTGDNEGLYTCVAENNVNYTQSEFYLNILDILGKSINCHII